MSLGWNFPMSAILSMDHFSKIQWTICSKMLYFSKALVCCYEYFRITCRKFMKYGARIEDSLIINHSKFGVSNSNSLAPPIGQICTHVSANKFWRSKSKIIFFLWFLGSYRVKCIPKIKFKFCNFEFSKKNYLKLVPDGLSNFSPKLAQIIFRAFWQKVNKSFWYTKPIYQNQKIGLVKFRMAYRIKRYL